MRATEAARIFLQGVKHGVRVNGIAGTIHADAALTQSSTCAPAACIGMHAPQTVFQCVPQHRSWMRGAA